MCAIVLFMLHYSRDGLTLGKVYVHYIYVYAWVIVLYWQEMYTPHITPFRNGNNYT